MNKLKAVLFDKEVWTNLSVAGGLLAAYMNGTIDLATMVAGGVTALFNAAMEAIKEYRAAV